MSNPSVLITGAAGYIGSILTEDLVRGGYEVVAVDSLIYDQLPFGNLFVNDNLRFVRGDVTNDNFMKNLLTVEHFDFIIPLAAIVGFQPCDLQTDLAWRTNTRAIDTILRYRDVNSGIIFPTTNSGYGNKNGGLYCTEDTPLTPISEYGRSKVEAERIVLSVKNTISLRLATVFGFSPRMRTDLLVNDFVLRAVRDRALVLYEKEYKRNILHVRDCAWAFQHAMKQFEQMKGNVYNVGDSRYNISKGELAEMIRMRLPKTKIFYVDDQKDPDQRNYIVSNDKIERTGFSCRHDLPSGIDELIEGYKAMSDRRFRNI